jgi:hypothetical protein
MNAGVRLGSQGIPVFLFNPIEPKPRRDTGSIDSMDALPHGEGMVCGSEA